MDGTINGKSGQYVLLADYIVSTATTFVDFTGLNIGKDEEIELVSDVLNGSASSRELLITVNGNNTISNYYAQYLQASSTTVSAERLNYPIFSYHASGKRSFSKSMIKLTNNSYITTINSTERDYDTTSNILFYTTTTSTFTGTSITQIRITSLNTNGIGIGSRFQLYKVGA